MSNAAHSLVASPLAPPRFAPALGSRIDRESKLALYVGCGLALLWLCSFTIGFKTVLGVLSVAGFALAVIGLQRPSLGLIGIGILCSLDSLMRVYLMKGGWLRYNTFNYWLLFVMVISLPMVFRHKDPNSKLLQAFSALLALELAISPSVRDGLLHLLNLVTVFGLSIYFYRCRRFPHIWYSLGISIGLMSALTGLAFFLNNENLAFWTVDERAYSDPDFADPNYIDPNALGYVFLTGLFSLCVALAWTRRTDKSLLPILVLLAVNTCWVMLVGSRGSILVASSCAIYVLFSMRSGTRRFKVISVFALSGLLVVNAFPMLLERSVHRVNKLMDDQYSAAERTSARSDLVIGAWRLFRKHPLGVGTGGYKKSWASLEVRDLGSSQAGHEKAAHSAWTKTLAENGLPGFLLFAAVVFSFAYVGIQQARGGSMPLGILVTVTLTSAFVSTEFTSKGIWFIVAATIAYLHYRCELPVQHDPRNQPSRLPASPSLIPTPGHS